MGAFGSNLTLIRDIHNIHTPLSPEQLNNMRADGIIRGMRGKGISQPQMYYINLWLVLAYQRLAVWDLVVDKSVVGTGNCGDEWALGKKRQREDDAGLVGSNRAGGQSFTIGEARDLLRRTRENTRRVSQVTWMVMAKMEQLRVGYQLEKGHWTRIYLLHILNEFILPGSFFSSETACFRNMYCLPFQGAYALP